MRQSRDDCEVLDPANQEPNHFFSFPFCVSDLNDLWIIGLNFQFNISTVETTSRHSRTVEHVFYFVCDLGDITSRAPTLLTTSLHIKRIIVSVITPLLFTLASYCIYDSLLYLFHLYRYIGWFHSHHTFQLEWSDETERWDSHHDQIIGLVK